MTQALPLPIIDTHQHLWDLDRLRPPWLEGKGPPLERSYRPEAYQAAALGLGVLKAVYMEIDVAPLDQAAEAEQVLALIRRPEPPTVAAVISAGPATEAFPSYISRFRGNPAVKGVRQILNADGVPPGFCLDPKFVGGLRLLGDLGLHFDLCMRPGELADGARLAGLCPDTRFILDHCGNPRLKAFGAEREAWKRGIDRLAGETNVTCKISGIIAGVIKGSWGPEILAPVIDHCLDAFGPDRVVFGSDWPVCLLGAPLSAWVGALQEIVRNRPLEDRRKLLHDNASRIYGLEGLETFSGALA